MPFTIPCNKAPSRHLQTGAVAQLCPPQEGDARRADASASKRPVTREIRWSALGHDSETQERPPHLQFDAIDVRDVRDVADAWHRASVKRSFWLEDIYAAPSALPSMPKDLSAQPRYMYARSNNHIAARYVTQLAQIGRREGFRMVVESLDLKGQAVPPSIRAEVTEVRTFDKTCSEWAEDDGHFHVGGGISVPARIDSPQLLDASILTARRERLGGLPTDFASCGQVDITAQQKQKIALALAGSRPLRECLSHVEGGNILPGTLANGERYGLVGRDSVAITQALLARDSMEHITRRRAMLAIAKDHGLAAKNLFPVEQPGDFHLDMCMVLMGPGQVVLNDVREAAELEITWIKQDLRNRKPDPPRPDATHEEKREHKDSMWMWRCLRNRRRLDIKTIRERTAQRAAFEARTYQDLVDTKQLTVLRMAGRFEFYPDRANFLNGEGGTNPAGERYFVTQGGDPRAMAYIADAYLRRFPTGLKRMYFLDAEASAASLSWNGGLGCRAKTHGIMDFA